MSNQFHCLHGNPIGSVGIHSDTWDYTELLLVANSKSVTFLPKIDIVKLLREFNIRAKLPEMKLMELKTFVEFMANRNSVTFYSYKDE